MWVIYPHNECCGDVDVDMDVQSTQIKNDCICQKLQVVHIEDKMLQGHLRWFGYVMSRPIDAPIRRCKTMASKVLEGQVYLNYMEKGCLKRPANALNQIHT